MSNGSGSGGPGPIPQRWLECPRKSDGLINGVFLAFKTPLSTKFNAQVPNVNLFTPSMLFDSMKSYKIRIGLWIDLTNTSRFYDKGEIESHECRYLKLSCKGHGEVPTKESVDTFNTICSTFKSRFPLLSIGVHCTHGFNRTGFLICSYLVEKMDMSCDYAVQLFAKTRSPGIYKQDYLEQLFQRYGEDEPVPLAPELPSWHTECDDSDHISFEGTSNGSGGGGGRGRGRNRGRGEKNRHNPTFMEGVSGVYPVITEPTLSKVRGIIQRMCNFKSSGFPGCQPISMSNENINQLKHDLYFVSWKADGTRYMMLINGHNEVYFSDRDNSIFHAPNVEFRSKGNLDDPLQDTLLDGEMVIDTDPKSGLKYPRYLIYDAIRVGGKDVRKDPFRKRWERVMTDVISPRSAAIMKGKLDKSKEPFSVRRKDFWEATAENTHKLLSDNFKRQLAHEPDGLIFQPNEKEYFPGRCDAVLKWKPHTHNSVDFKLKINVRKGEGILTQRVGELYAGGCDQPLGYLKYSKMLKDYDNKIVECNVNESGEWLFMRERTDKSFPNSYKTAKAVAETICNPVTQQFLLDFIHNFSFRKPDASTSKLMPPPPPKHVPPQPHQHQQQQQQQQRHRHAPTNGQLHDGGDGGMSDEEPASSGRSFGDVQSEDMDKRCWNRRDSSDEESQEQEESFNAPLPKKYKHFR